MNRSTRYELRSSNAARWAGAVNRSGVRVFFDRVAPESQEEKVDVLELVRTGSYEFVGCHALRHVAAHTQSAPVRFRDDHRNERRVERAVDLDLLVSKICITIHPGARAVRR